MSKTKKSRKNEASSDESDESSTSDPSTSESSTDESTVAARKRKHKKKSKKVKKHKSRKKHESGSDDESSSTEEEVVKRKKHKKHKKKRKHQAGSESEPDDDEVVKIQETDKVLYISSGDEDKSKHVRRDKRLEELKKLRSGVGGVAERPEVREVSKWDSPVDERELDRRRPGNSRGFENSNRDKYDARHKEDDRHRGDDRFAGGRERTDDFRRRDRRPDGGAPRTDDNYFRRGDDQHQRSYDDRRHMDGGSWNNNQGHQDGGGGGGDRHYNAYRGGGNRPRFDRSDRPYNDRSNNFGGGGRGGRRPFNDQDTRYNDGQRGDNFNRRPFENFNDRRDMDGNGMRRNNPFSRRISDGARVDHRRSTDREPVADDHRWHHDNNGRDRGDRNRGDRGRRGSFTQGLRRDQSGGLRDGSRDIRRGYDNERRFDDDRRDKNERRSLSRQRDSRDHHFRGDSGRAGSLRDNSRQRIQERRRSGGGGNDDSKPRNSKFQRNFSPKKEDDKNSRSESEHRSRKRSENSQPSRSNSNTKNNDRDRSQDPPKRQRRNDKDNDTFEWGKKSDKSDDKSAKSPEEKEKPNFGLSGKLTEDTNKVNGIIIKYAEPAEARKPKRRWRLYPFKGEQSLQTLYIHRQSCYLIGRDRKICDLPVDHPSCSKQHAVLQYRLVPFKRDDGSTSKRIRPYLLDMESANGTFVNNKKIEPKKYMELFEKDVIKFGFSSREYVLLHENSKDVEFDDDVELHDETIKSEPQLHE